MEYLCLYSDHASVWGGLCLYARKRGAFGDTVCLLAGGLGFCDHHDVLEDFGPRRCQWSGGGFFQPFLGVAELLVVVDSAPYRALGES